MSPSAALLAVAALWGGTFVVIKEGLGDASPLVFVGLRFLVAALATAPAVRGGRAAWRRALGPGIPLGVVLFLGYATQTQGLLTTTPARSAFLTGMCVPMVPLWAAALFGARPPRASLAGLAVALPGLWLLTSPGAGAWVRGDAWTLACAACFALHVVLVARWADRAGTVPLVAVQLATVAVLALAASPLLETPRAAPTPRLALAVALTALLATALATFLQMRYQPRLDPTRAALLYTMEPVFAALFATWWGESITAPAWTGGLLIAAGAAISETRPRFLRARKAPTTSERSRT